MFWLEHLSAAAKCRFLRESEIERILTRPIFSGLSVLGVGREITELLSQLFRFESVDTRCCVTSAAFLGQNAGRCFA